MALIRSTRHRHLGARHVPGAAGRWRGHLRQVQRGAGLWGLIAIIGGLAPAEGGGMVPMVAATRRATRITVGSRRMFEDMNRALEVSKLHPVIDRVFEFEEALDTYRYLESQSHFGKVVVRV